MNKIILTLFSALILIACSQKHDSENTIAETETTISVNKLNSTIKDSANSFLQRDSLIATWYTNLIDITNTDLNFSSEKKPQLNKYNVGQIDTIECLIFKESNLTIYRTADKNILIGSDIQNSEISLSKGIKVGISRNVLLKTLNTESNRDTIIVTDFENNTNVTLILKNNLLKQIMYCGYID